MFIEYSAELINKFHDLGEGKEHTGSNFAQNFKEALKKALSKEVEIQDESISSSQY